MLLAALLLWSFSHKGGSDLQQCVINSEKKVVSIVNFATNYEALV